MDDLALDYRKLNNPLAVIRHVLAAMTMLGKPGLRTFVWVPMLINLLLYSLAFWLAYSEISGLIDKFVQYIPEWLSWLEWLVWPLFAVSFLLIVFFTFTLLSNLVASPFYGILAERTEKLLTGQPLPPVSQEPLMKEMIKGPLSELKRLGYFLVRAIPLLLLFLIPGVNVVAPVLWIIFSAWFLALEYFAYPLEGRGLLFPEQRGLMSRARIGSVSLGGLVMMATSIPLLNLIAAPTAVIAATRLVVLHQQASSPDNG